MTALPTRSKDTIVATFAAAAQGRLNRFLNFAVGSVLLAVAEAASGVALWLQAQNLQVLKQTRAATSDGDDLKSWIADYGMEPLPAVPATGLVTFSRFTAGPTSVVIPVGAAVQTGDGSQRFEVYADSQVSSYSATQGGYVLAPGLASLDVPVQAVAAGADGNVTAGAISLLAASVPGIDAVTNAVGFVNGSDPETDDSIKARIPGYFASLSQATEPALTYAIQKLGLNLDVSFLRRDPALGQPYVTIVVDDGSGNPPDTLVQAASAAVGKVRAAGVWVPVIGAQTLPASIAMLIDAAPGYRKPDVVSAVVGAVTLYVNGLDLGQTLRRSRLEQIAYNAHPGVENVSNVTVNGARIDLFPTGGQTVKLTALTVS